MLTAFNCNEHFIIRRNILKVVDNVNSQIANNYMLYINGMKTCVSIENLVMIDMYNEIHGRAALDDYICFINMYSFSCKYNSHINNTESCCSFSIIISNFITLSIFIPM